MCGGEPPLLILAMGGSFGRVIIDLLGKMLDWCAKANWLLGDCLALVLCDPGVDSCTGDVPRCCWHALLALSARPR